MTVTVEVLGGNVNVALNQVVESSVVLPRVLVDVAVVQVVLVRVNVVVELMISVYGQVMVV